MMANKLRFDISITHTVRLSSMTSGKAKPMSLPRHEAKCIIADLHPIYAIDLGCDNMSPSVVRSQAASR